MPQRHWRARVPVRPPAVLFVSELRLRSLRAVPMMFRLSSAVYRQVIHSDGALRLDLYAMPLRRTFRIRSAWRDHDSIQSFVAAEPHASVMRRLHPALEDAAFAIVELPEGEAYPTWADALANLNGPQAHRLTTA